MNNCSYVCGVSCVEEALVKHESPESCRACAHDHANAASSQLQIVRLAIGAVLFGAAIFGRGPWDPWLYMAAYLTLGGPTLWHAIRGGSRGRLFSESFLMSVATMGAIAIGEYPEAVAVMLFYEIGEMLQEAAAGRSRRSIKSLIDVRPEYANLLESDDTVSVVEPQQIVPGQRIIVRPGERVPLDGEIMQGRSFVDTAALTGESVPRQVGPGSTVLSGFVNQTGLLTIQVSTEFSESAVARILRLVEDAGAHKAPTERFISRFARFYTPAVVAMAAILALIPPLLFQGSWQTWGYRALLFLVISCPCALVVSVPLGFFAGLGAAARRGILIKGASFLEGLHSIHTVAFDKTGTLTEGVFSVTAVRAQPGTSADELLQLAVLAEQHSLHPIAESLRQAYGEPVIDQNVSDSSEIAGEGVTCRIGADEVAVGNSRLMAHLGVQITETGGDAATLVHVARNRRYMGHIVISDRLRPDAPRAIEELRELGVERIAMLTGDRRTVAEAIGERLGIDTVRSELLPDGKVAHLEQLKEGSLGRVLFVGDGLNDAPVLARADVGVAMGGLGAEAALEAADIVLMTDEPSRLAEAITIARRTRLIVWQNILLAFIVKGTVLALGGLGIASLWQAVFADVGVALLAVLNSSRLIVRPLPSRRRPSGSPARPMSPALHSDPGQPG
jgi:Cd2+/Zn2+-exporting ATPase